jgi:hypothetical protein
MTVWPVQVAVRPGQTVQFMVTNAVGTIPPSEVTWSVEPPGVGTIDAKGLFITALVPVPGYAVGSVLATLKSDSTRVGMAVLVIEQPPGAPNLLLTMVSASGGMASGGEYSNEAVVSEPVAATTSKGDGGVIEMRSGFHPSGGEQ